MASGNDARLAVSKEVTYGTRVAPARFFPFLSEDFAYSYEKIRSNSLGTNRWNRVTQLGTSAGAGSISFEAPSVGLGYWLDLLHGNTVTPAQQAATTAYLQTHTLDTPPSKSASIQVQVPPVLSSTLVPHDLVGVRFSGATFSWDPQGPLTCSFAGMVRELMTGQTAATYVAPPAWEMLTFRGGSLKIAGVTEANIVGGGSIEIGASLRTAYELGSSGLMAAPVETDKPTASGSFTKDFIDNVQLQRTIDNTIATVILRFEGSTIESTYKYYVEIEIPDCEFTSPRATVGGPGPVSQAVSFSNSSSTGAAPIIRYMSTAATTAL